jgi:hypothetical protein
MTGDRIVALGLLTQAHLDRIGPDLTHVWPIDKAPCFSELLLAIDDVDRERWRGRDEAPNEFAPLFQKQIRC